MHPCLEESIPVFSVRIIHYRFQSAAMAGNGTPCLWDRSFACLRSPHDSASRRHAESKVEAKCHASKMVCGAPGWPWPSVCHVRAIRERCASRVAAGCRCRAASCSFVQALLFQSAINGWDGHRSQIRTDRRLVKLQLLMAATAAALETWAGQRRKHRRSNGARDSGTIGVWRH